MDLFWDPAKEARNLRKHGLDFSFAALVFADPLAVTLFDRIEGGEKRWHTIGTVGPAGTLLLVVHTDPEDGACLRIIGVRAATRPERRRYEEDPA